MAWADPGTGPDGPTVRAMFARIAHRYDLNNRLHSLGRDQAWRRAAVRAAGPCGGKRVLDVACGTGDLAGMFAAAGAATVVGADFCPEMLALAARKFPQCSIDWLCCDAHALPFSEASFDVLSIAFGLRNLSDPARALAEFYRVLAPGGRVVVLEFHPDSRRWLARLVRGFTRRVMVYTAGAIAGDAGGAYDYLCRSVQSFWTAGRLGDELTRAGFVDVNRRALTAGVAFVHAGRKP